MNTDIILPVFNLLDLTKICVDSLKQQKHCRLIIIDNGSDDSTLDYLRSLATTLDVIIIRNKTNLGYVKAINQGLKATTAETILLANNDCIFTPGLLDKLRDGLKNFDLIGPLSNNVGKNMNQLLIKYTFSSTKGLNKFSNHLAIINKDKVINVDYLYGHCLMMKREVYENIGPLDERFGIGNYDDLDFCKRAKNYGYRIGLREDAFVYHFTHATFNKLEVDLSKLMTKNEKVFIKKWQ